MDREETTTFDLGVCVRCGATSHTLHEGGEYCDGCARRVTWPRSAEESALRGEYDG